MPKVIKILVLSIICLAVMTCCSNVDPVQKSREMLEAGEISTLVQYYNVHAEKIDKEKMSEIDQLLTDYIQTQLLLF